MRRLLVSLALVLATRAPARADRDPYDALRRADGTLPLRYDNLDRMRVDFATAELALSGVTDLRLTGMDFVMPLSRDYRDRDALLLFGLEALTHESIALAAPAATYEVEQALGLSVRGDLPIIGAFAGAHVVTLLASGDGDVSLLTPWLGVRVGQRDVAQLVGTARYLGAHVFTFGGRRATFFENRDLSLTAEVPLSRAWRLQARARLRDLALPDAELAELTATVGVEGALPSFARLLPVYVGVGARQVRRHAERIPIEGTTHDHAEREAPGWQLLVVLRVNLGIEGDSAIW